MLKKICNHKESGQILPIKKPYLFKSELRFRDNRKNISKLLKAQNKHLCHMNLFFQTSSGPYNKLLLKDLCNKYSRNLRFMKLLTLQEGYSTKLAIKNILHLRKCLQTAQSLTHLQITGSSLRQVRILAPFIKGLKELEVVSLDFGCIIQNPFGNKLFASLKALKGLRELRFRVQRGKPPAGAFEKLKAGLSRLQSLQSINFDFNGSYLSENQEIFFDFRALKCLTGLTLNLDYIERLGDKSLENIAESLKQVPQLEKLDLSFYYCPQITCQGVENLSYSLPQGLKFLKINLGYCEQVKEEGVRSLFRSIGKISPLEHLSLLLSSQNKILNEGLLDLNLCLSRLKHLKSLNISFMSMSGDVKVHNLVFDEFLCVLASKTALKNLVLQFSSGGINMINDQRLDKFGSALTNLKEIETLIVNFGHPNFSDAATELFSEKLKSFEKLHTLSLNFSHSYTVENAKMIGKFVKNLEKLKALKKATLNFEYCSCLDKEEVEKILPNPNSLKFELSVLYENTVYMS